MPVLPEAASLAEFGGKFSDGLVAVVDSTTDLSSAQFNAISATVAGASRMVPRCEVVFTGHATTPVFVAFESVWKAGSPASPAIARTATGVFTATFASTVVDELGGVHSVNFRRAWAQVEGATCYTANATVSANVITVNVFLTSTGVADNAAAATIVVWAR